MSPVTNRFGGSTLGRLEAFWSLARRIAQIGTQGVARLEFLRAVSSQLLDFSQGTSVDMWMCELDQDYHWHMQAGPESVARFELLSAEAGQDETVGTRGRLQHRVSGFWHRLFSDESKAASLPRSFIAQGSAARHRLREATSDDSCFSDLVRSHEDSPKLILTLKEHAGFMGLVVLTAAREGTYHPHELFLYEQVAETLERSVMNRRAQFRLRERIKELTCLHGIAQIARDHGNSLEKALKAIVNLMPAAMQFPEIAAARLTIDDHVYSTTGFVETKHQMQAYILAGGRRRGSLEVSYRMEHPEFAAGAFLREECDLLASVAHEVAMLIDRAEAAAAQASLSEQLRHADRLASIGQLAAGIAHELNEPLGNVLGFAQLIEKHDGLPTDARHDTEQIVRAALHGREIVKKLLLFARQSAAQRVELDLNNLIRDSLTFFEVRCRHSAIELRLELTYRAAPIVATPSEMTQVLVNLAVNAIQAMPRGGVLTIRTRNEAGSVVLSVEDTGVGMDDATRSRIFTPFFTTKDIGQGTGLGLSVVHGIITAHGGTIRVESAPGRGSRFEICLPMTTQPETAATTPT